MHNITWQLRALLTKAFVALISVVLLIWTLLPLYHMLILSLTPIGAAFAGRLWPETLTFENYGIVLTQQDHYLSMFWRQLGNSLFVALTACLIVLVCSLMAAFAIARLRPRFGPAASQLALVSYFVPATFLAIPFYQVMASYHLLGSRAALILAVVTFAAPYAIWILQQNSDGLPYELDEAARIDGATTSQLFRLVYVPLMVPSIVAVGAFALMLAWNEYLYAFLLISDKSKITMPVVMGQFLNDDSPPWPLLMATGILYSLPPAVLYLLRDGSCARGFCRAGSRANRNESLRAADQAGNANICGRRCQPRPQTAELGLDGACRTWRSALLSRRSCLRRQRQPLCGRCLLRPHLEDWAGPERRDSRRV